MAFKPMFALHKDKAGNVLTASSFKYDHNLSGWLRDLDVRAGDNIEFHEAAERPEFDEVEEPPLRKAEKPDPPMPTLTDEEQPF